MFFRRVLVALAIQVFERRDEFPSSLARLYHFSDPSLFTVIAALAVLWFVIAVVLRLMRS